ncbi:MAG: OmpH family outer membrane protein [Phycisphaerae bacterium]|nr:OmpH family outer membrane protein [Phycisphaerae bacterium]
MKSRNFIIVILLSVLGCFCVLNKQGIAKSGKDIAPTKVAVVNMQKVIVESKKKKEYDAKYKAYTEKANNELQEIKNEIDASRGALKLLKPISDEYAKLGNSILEKETLLEVKQKYYQQAIPAQQQRWVDISFLSIANEVQKIAKAEGYDLVLDQDSARVVYYATEIDITDAVLEAWDAVK